MSLSNAPGIVRHVAEAELEKQALAGSWVMAAIAWHSLLWLVVANCVGVLLATMLLVPSINLLFGEWTYGRWMPVHMNLQLYGWCSLPPVGFLFSVYGVHADPLHVGHPL